MMAYEFATRVTPDGHFRIPEGYTHRFPTGKSVRVIVLVNELISTTPRLPESLFVLEDVIAEIQNTPQNLANVTSAKEFTEADLQNWEDDFDPLFNVAEWNQQWDKLEAEMKTMECAERKLETENQV